MSFKDTYRIGIYEKAMPQELTWRERLLFAAEAGFDFLEMSIDETDMRISRLEWSDEQIDELLKTQLETGIFIESICLSAQRRYPLGSLKWEKEAKDLLRKAVVFAKKMGVRLIQLQGYDCYYEEKSDDTTKERFYRNLEEETMYAAAHGIVLGLETMENDFMNTIEKAMYSVNRVNSPYLNVYPDIGNIYNGTDDVIEDIAKGRGHIVAAHLKETVPGVFREVPYGQGQVDFPASIAQLYRHGIRRYVAEFWYTGEPDWREIVKANRQFIEMQFLQAEQLLQGRTM